MRLTLSFALVLAAGCGGNSGTHPTTQADMAVAPTHDLAMAMGGPDMRKPPPCDPATQSYCLDPANPKCTFTWDANNMDVVPTCLPQTGTGMDGAACMRSASDMTGIGMDDCAGGFYCSGYAPLTNPPVRHCRKFCSDDNQCGASEKCILASQTQTDGYCVPSCTFFAAGCPNSSECTLLVTDIDGAALFGVCRAVGTVALGKSCTQPTDCVASALCYTPQGAMTGTCTALCDANHTCPTGTCMPVMGLPNNGGLCQ